MKFSPKMKRNLNEHIQKQAAEIDYINHNFKCHKFSQSYLDRKAEILETADIKLKKRKQKKRQRVLILITAIILLISLASCSKTFRKFIVNVYEEFTSFFIQSESGGTNISALDIEFDYMPDGYILIENLKYDTFAEYKYRKDSDNSEIYMTIDTSLKSQKNINNENTNVTYEYINGFICEINHYDNGDIGAFMITDIAVIHIDSTLSDVEIVKLIQSLSITPK